MPKSTAKKSSLSGVLSTFEEAPTFSASSESVKSSLEPTPTVADATSSVETAESKTEQTDFVFSTPQHDPKAVPTRLQRFWSRVQNIRQTLGERLPWSRQKEAEAKLEQAFETWQVKLQESQYRSLNRLLFVRLNKTGVIATPSIEIFVASEKLRWAYIHQILHTASQKERRKVFETFSQVVSLL